MVVQTGEAEARGGRGAARDCPIVARQGLRGERRSVPADRSNPESAPKGRAAGRHFKGGKTADLGTRPAREGFAALVEDRVNALHVPAQLPGFDELDELRAR